MENIPDAKDFVMTRFCLGSYDPAKLKLAEYDQFRRIVEQLGAVFLVYDDTYEFMYHTETHEFGVWLGGFDECCGMSCDYYCCDKNYK